MKLKYMEYVVKADVMEIKSETTHSITKAECLLDGKTLHSIHREYQNLCNDLFRALDYLYLNNWKYEGEVARTESLTLNGCSTYLVYCQDNEMNECIRLILNNITFRRID